MQTIDLAIQLIITSADTGHVRDVVETVADDPSDARSVKSAIRVLTKLAAKFDPYQHKFHVHVDPEAKTLAETAIIGLEPGTPRRCRKMRLCVPVDEQDRNVLASGGYPVDLDTYVIRLLGTAAKADSEEREDRKAAAEAVRKADREAARRLHSFNEPVPYGTRILQEPKPVEAFPGREERRRAELLPAAERQWVEDTVQGVASIIAEVACGQDIYLDEGEFIEVAAEVEDRIDPALAAKLLDEVGGRFRRRPRVVWLNITDTTIEWALAEAERRASEGGEDGPTEALLDRIRAAIRRTWQAIAYDVLQAAGADTLPLDEVVEVTLDADHVHFHGGDREAAKALDALDFSAQNAIAEKALS